MKTLFFSLLAFTALLGFSSLVPTAAQSALPPCDQRPHFIDPPWVDTRYFCAEQVIHDSSGGELGFTALVAAPDGTLYAARPLWGQVWALTDGDGDGLPETARLAAQGLTLPNGLAYHDDALYITGGSHIYRLRGDDLTMLVDEVPAGVTGFWTGGIAVSADERLVIATGAPCDFCLSDEPGRGAILSYVLDGRDPQVVANGLRQPTGLAFRNGELWTVDSARDGLFDAPELDELNRVTPGAHFGWPFCIGPKNQPDDLSGAFDCAQATPPAFTFPTHSQPLGLTLYDGEAFPHLRGQLLVTLGGSYNETQVQGYTLNSIAFDAADQPAGYTILLPHIPTDNPTWQNLDLLKTHYQKSGFWPYRPMGVTVSREGWIYVSASGGRIWALRPR